MTPDKRVEEIRNILIELTDVTGFNHSPESLFAFEQAVEKLTNSLTQHHQDLMMEKKLEVEDMIERGGWSPNQIEQLRDLFELSK